MVYLYRRYCIYCTKSIKDTLLPVSEADVFCCGMFHVITLRYMSQPPISLNMSLRPDLMDLMFLRSFPDSFQWVKRNKTKNKTKNKEKIAWKCKMFIFLNHFLFPGFFLTLINNKCTGGSRKQQINWVWPNYYNTVQHQTISLNDIFTQT